MNPITTRPVVAADIEAITTIYEDAVIHGTATYELEPPSQAEMVARFESLRKEGFPYICAEQDGRLLGYAYAGPFRARPAYRFIVEDSIYLAPEAKGKGLGRLLLRELLMESERLGFRQMIAVIGDGHPDSPSVRLHQALGFKHSGSLEGSGYKHDRWLDTVFMQYALNGGNAAHPDPNSLPERQFRNQKS